MKLKMEEFYIGNLNKQNITLSLCPNYPRFAQMMFFVSSVFISKAQN